MPILDTIVYNLSQFCSISKTCRLWHCLAYSGMIWYDLAYSGFTDARLFQRMPDHFRLPDTTKIDILVDKIINLYYVHN